MHRFLSLAILGSACTAPPAEPVRAGPERVARQYFDALARARYRDAWGLMSAPDREAISEADYLADLEGVEPALRQRLEHRVTVREASVVARVVLEVTGPEPAAVLAVIHRAAQNGELKDLSGRDLLEKIARAVESGEVPIDQGEKVIELVEETDGWRVRQGWDWLDAAKPALDASDPIHAELRLEVANLLRRNAPELYSEIDEPIVDALGLELWFEQVCGYRQPPEPCVAPTVAPIVRTEKPVGVEAEICAGIKRVSDNRSTITRESRDRLFASGAVVAESARVIPSFHDGRVEGFRIFAIMPDSVFAALGFKNGDLISSINKIVLDSPDAAFAAIHALKNASSATFELMRRGTPTTIVITLE